MALITKGYTFSAGSTILSAEVNSDFDVIYADYNGNVTNANIAAGAAIVDTKLAQITTAGKVSGAALTSLGSIPQQTTTTGNAFLIDSDTLTTGSLALFDSNSSDTGTRTLVKIVNDNTAATGATAFSIQQDAAQNSMLITHTAATGTLIDLSAVALTTAKVIDISDLDAITTGKAIHIDATGVTQTDGILVHIDSASTALTSTGRLLLVDHTGNAGVSNVNTEFKSAAADETTIVQINATAALAAGVMLDMVGTSMTTGTGIDLGGLNALTSGIGLNITSSATAITGAGRLLYTSHSGTTGTSAILNEFASAATDETIIGRITASGALTGVVLDLVGTTIATGTVLDIGGINALTTGIALNITSSATAITGAGRLIYSNHSGATGTSAILNEFLTAATDETVLMKLTASSTLLAGIMLDISGAAVTTGTLVDITDADALTTGSIMNLFSNSADTGTRTLVHMKNDHASADDTEVLRLTQDGDDFALYVDYNATVSDTITGVRIDGCDVANGANTVTITNVAPAGVGTATIDSWLAVNIGGTTKYIPLWT